MRCLNCGEKGITLDAEICPNCGVHLPSLLRGCLPASTLLSHETYRIDYPIGRGGFGITYRAFDLRLERAVAIKEFFPQEYALREQTTGLLRVPSTQKQGAYQRGLERFLREGRLLAGLDHLGVVKVFNAFQERGTAYLAMELVEGRTLREEIDRQPDRKLSPERVTEVISKLVDALDNVHRKGVYHLDISPDNVMIADDGRAIMIDFGASRQGLGGQTTQAYKEAYAPPEVLNGVGMGAESDIFELGMMLCELLTGTLPPSAISRLTSVISSGRDTWEPSGLEEPWLGLVSGAIRLKQQERPQNICDWWDYAFSVSASPGDETGPVPPPASFGDGADSVPLLAISPAGFWLRFIAWLIDSTVLTIGSFILTFILTISQTASNLFVCYIVLDFVYSVTLDSSPKQGTYGKQIMGIKVTDSKGRRIDFQRVITRHSSKIISYLIFGIGFLMPAFTNKKKALHDRIAKTLVIENLK